MSALSPRARWAERIRAASRKTVEQMIQTGKLLIAARKKLDHGEFIRMVEHDLPFKRRTAQRLMSIARSPVTSKASNWTFLPPALHTLRDLARLPESTFNAKLARGEINRDTTRRELGLQIETLHEQPPAQTDEEETHATLKRMHRNRVIEAVNTLCRIAMTDSDEIARALRAHSPSAGNWLAKNKLDRAVEILMFVQAEYERLERIEHSARERAGVVVPFSQPRDAPPL
jgi:hypothetical protein